MTQHSPHIGSTFESWLDEEGIREEVTAAAIKAVVAHRLADEMKAKGITKPRWRRRCRQAGRNSTACSIPTTSA